MAAALAREKGIECLGQVVFMTKNAATLAGTVSYLADAGVESVDVLQLLDVNGRSGLLDPLVHFSAEYVESIKRDCIEAARSKRTRLIWNAGGYERHDFRVRKVPPRVRKDWNYRWEERMRRTVPGYCINVQSRVQVDADGTITPCAYATDDDLVLGRLGDQPLEDIWNGANARDLRRAMLTWDYPALCGSCMRTNKRPPEVYLPFVAGGAGADRAPAGGGDGLRARRDRAGPHVPADGGARDQGARARGAGRAVGAGTGARRRTPPPDRA